MFSFVWCINMWNLQMKQPLSLIYTRFLVKIASRNVGYISLGSVLSIFDRKHLVSVQRINKLSSCQFYFNLLAFYKSNRILFVRYVTEKIHCYLNSGNISVKMWNVHLHHKSNDFVSLRELHNIQILHNRFARILYNSSKQLLAEEFQWLIKKFHIFHWTLAEGVSYCNRISTLLRFALSNVVRDSLSNPYLVASFSPTRWVIVRSVSRRCRQLELETRCVC